MVTRQNSLKHGLTGKGIVVPEGDQEEIQRRVEDLTLDMKPRSPAGVILILQMAILSLRAERASQYESAALSMRIRHAADTFDQERLEQVNTFFEALGENPRDNLRKLKRMPEGVERLIHEWRDLRADLCIEPKPVWTAMQLEQAANMTGLKTQHARGSRLGALSNGFWGDFAALGEADGGNLDDAKRKAWSKTQLIERIDAEIAALEAHYETLDFETIELDRAEAGQRALFDTSKEATLARRYEAEARRSFFKAMKEFRQVEAESEAKAKVSSAPNPAGYGTGMGSSRENGPPPGHDPSRAFPDAPLAYDPIVRGPEGQPIRPIRPDQTPG